MSLLRNPNIRVTPSQKLKFSTPRGDLLVLIMGLSVFAKSKVTQFKVNLDVALDQIDTVIQSFVAKPCLFDSKSPLALLSEEYAKREKIYFSAEKFKKSATLQAQLDVLQVEVPDDFKGDRSARRNARISALCDKSPAGRIKLFGSDSDLKISGLEIFTNPVTKLLITHNYVLFLLHYLGEQLVQNGLFLSGDSGYFIRQNKAVENIKPLLDENTISAKVKLEFRSKFLRNTDGLFPARLAPISESDSEDESISRNLNIASETDVDDSASDSASDSGNSSPEVSVSKASNTYRRF